jgi:hypothetical protein
VTLVLILVHAGLGCSSNLGSLGQEGALRQGTENIREGNIMPYVTSFERVERRAGLREGIGTALKIKFGDAGLELMPEIEEVHEEEKLRKILKALETAASPDEVRRLWTPPSP